LAVAGAFDAEFDNMRVSGGCRTAQLCAAQDGKNTSQTITFNK
jgi:hypothetical protein